MSDSRIVTQDLGDWIVRMEWPAGVENGGPGVLLIEPANPETYPPGGVSSTVLREIDFRAALETLRSQSAASQRWSNARETYEAERAERLRDAATQGVTDEYLALLASAYVSATNRGQAKPLDYLAQMVGKTPSTVKGHLWQARKKELLSGSAGRAGGQLTDAATRILARIVPGAPEGFE
ncbi:hypothetical protein ACWDSF_03280 [Nocardia beijingensis]